ncbi:hypothetical protein [Luteimonas sp. FCS-9]|uniref:hypothetical protein n=1 Tax=Luteimonas sp. FCS-9 TaxID=1547516 RepID=UPI00063EC4B8|nr:hypothetical protein [Luteimonas sp. FCS-9]KLI97778.1 hypothetical protein WQ56_16490 [Luteimonas sp. FCS-9]
MTPPNAPRTAADDAALRALYGRAQARISAATTARLHRARHAATTGAPARRGWAWPVAAGFAALFALAIGVQSLAPLPPATGEAAPVPVLAEADGAASIEDGVADALATYEESPDFYLWLAANESTLLAME